jgi:hypothetical protein
MAGTRKGACKMQAAYGALEATAVMQQSDKGQTAHGSDLHLFRGHVWRVGQDKADDSGWAGLSQHSSPASRDCSSDVLYGDTGLLPPGVLMMLPNCVGSTDARTWRLADGPGGAAILIRG